MWHVADEGKPNVLSVTNRAHEIYCVAMYFSTPPFLRRSGCSPRPIRPIVVQAVAGFDETSVSAGVEAVVAGDLSPVW
jgi:hypothetical protein